MRCQEVYLAIVALGPLVGNHIWQSTLFAVAVCFAALFLRRNEARLRYALWLIASTKFLVPFSLLVSIGACFPHMPRIGPQLAMYSAFNFISRPFPKAPASQAPMGTPIPSNALHASEWASMGLATVWFVGMAVVLVVWISRWRRIFRILQNAENVEVGHEVGLLRAVERSIGTRAISIVISQDLLEPGIFGIFRPVIIWPMGLSACLDDDQMKTILAHELVHRDRMDNLTAAIHMVVEMIFWFHPLVWWMEHRLIEERELACDEAVVQIFQTPASYAEGLLKACRFCIESQLLCSSGIGNTGLSRRLQEIMTFRAESLSQSKRMLFVAFGICAVLGPVMFGLMQTNPAYGQILHSTGPRPSFEVATFKPSKSNEAQSILWDRRDGRMSATHVSVRALIKYAYNIRAPLDDQLTGGPSWVDREYFDVEAKADSSMVASMNKVSLTDSIQQFQLMLQSLLEERCALRVTSRQQQLPAYALIVARGGPKLKTVDVPAVIASSRVPPPPPPPAPPATGSAPPISEPKGGPFPGISQTGPNQITGTAVRMSWLADWLLSQEQEEDRLVVDQTGLKGNYDFVLNGVVVKNPSAPPGATPTGQDELTESMFTAINDQLGLRVVPTRAALEVLSIEHVNKPSVN